MKNLFAFLFLAGALNSFGAALVVFEESIGSSLTTYTETVEFLGPGDIKVFKFVVNESEFSWTDFHIELEVGDGPVFVPSGDFDGISFQQKIPFTSWAERVRVDVNGTEFGAGTGAWTVNRIDSPHDRINLFFHTFRIRPGDRVATVFDMTDIDPLGTKWRLKQIATIPEPGAALLVSGGLLILLRKRTLSKSRRSCPNL